MNLNTKDKIELKNINLKDLIEQKTGRNFKNNKICCPFHSEKTPSFSVHFNANANKETYKCFGCGKSGDAIQFLIDYCNMSFNEAKKELGLSVEKSENEKEFDKLDEYLTSISNLNFKYVGLFQFVNKENKAVYYKAKFLKPDGDKVTPYYHVEGDEIVKNRGMEEIPYNYYNILKGIAENKVIVITEGEKDANTLNHILNKNYAATSVKNVKDFSFLDGAKVYIIGDTGEAGAKYINNIKNNIMDIVKELKIINLPGLEELGDNKDITDWIEAGHSKEELYEAFNKSLDLKSKYELQQNSHGIYKQVSSKSHEGEYDKIYITNFQILKAISTVNIDENIEGVELILNTYNNKQKSIKLLANNFDDIKSFRNALGSMDLAFKGRINDLISLKEWISKYFINERYKIVNGNRFMYKDDSLSFITADGAISSKGIDKHIKSDNANLKIEFPKEELNKNELKELIKYLFSFTTPGRAYSIIGTIVNNLAVAQTEKLKISLHHLLIVGEAGCGKSTILKRVVASLLNYPLKEIKNMGGTTNFAMIKDLSSGNYTALYDEFKPSLINRNRLSNISDILRNLYDRSAISRGQKNLQIKNFNLSRPIIIAGEETYAFNESALIERSCIVYLSRNERTAENTEAMKYLMAHEGALNKLGRELIKEVLNLSVEDYKAIREGIETLELKDRLQNTALNICTGMEILNKVLKKYGLPIIKNYIDLVTNNIKTEMLEDKEEVFSTVEQLLKKFDELLESGKIYSDKIIQDKKNNIEIYIRTNDMLDEIRIYVKTTGEEILMLSNNDFKKQAKKAGYILASGREGKVIKIKDKPIRYDIYSKDKLRKLETNSIVEPELIKVDEEENKIIKGVFKKNVTQ